MKKSRIGMFIFFLIVAVFLSALYLYYEEPDVLMSRFYDSVYADRQEPAIEVVVNDTSAAYSLMEKEWSFQKNNGKWYAPSNDSADAEGSETGMKNGDNGSDELKPAADITSYEDKLQVNVDKAPDQTELKIIDAESGQTVREESATMTELPLPERNGTFTYQLTLEWLGENNPYRGSYSLEIPVKVELPAKFIFSGQQISQGQLLEVDVYYADDPGDIIFEQSIFDKFQWFHEEGFLRGYLPTNYNVKPGIYKIKYGVKSEGTEFTQDIELKEYDYHIQYLTVDSQVEAETRNDAAYAEYHKYYTPVRNQSAPERYYSESFALPVRGELTTEFGSTRYVNDLPTSYRHLGLDIAAEEGTAVKATNRGKVVLARFFTLTGNTVMIDHGEGIFSVYHHMKSFSVKIGEMVEREQTIGVVGTTGFSTGPHLHFMISYYNTNLEPGYFLVGEPITLANYNKFIANP